MKIAFWNINTGKSSWFDRRDVFQRWRNEMDPDLLFLEEVSETLNEPHEADDDSGSARGSEGGITEIEHLSQMKMICWAETLMRITKGLELGATIPPGHPFPSGVTAWPAHGLNQKESTKNLCVLCKRGTEGKFKAEVLACEFLTKGGLRRPIKAKRSCMEVWCDDLQCYVVGLHANASIPGGKMAVGDFAKIIGHNKANKPEYIVGGDFNLELRGVKHELRTLDDAEEVEWCHPISWPISDDIPPKGVELPFTQWKKSENQRELPTRRAAAGEADGGFRELNWGKFSEADRAYAKNTLLKKRSTGTFIVRPDEGDTPRVLDYVLFRDGRQVTSLCNCKDEEMWVDILKQFDHCPVLYDIEGSASKGKKRLASSTAGTSSTASTSSTTSKRKK